MDEIKRDGCQWTEVRGLEGTEVRSRMSDVRRERIEDGGRKTEDRKENRGDRKEFDILDFLPRASVLEESSKALKEYLGMMAGRITRAI